MDALLAAARLGDPVAHTASKGWMIAGLIGGALLGAAVVALTGGTALIALAAVAAGAAAGGGLGEVLGTMSWAPRHVTGSLITGSPNVFINSRSAMRAHLSQGTCSDHSGSPQIVAQGSATVFINAQPASRKNDLLACSAVISDGSPNVFIGGSTVTTDEISPEVPGWVNTAMLAVGFAAAVVLAGPLVAVLGTAGGIGGGMLGSAIGGHYFGEGSDGQKWSMLGGSLAGGLAAGKGATMLESPKEPVALPVETTRFDYKINEVPKDLEANPAGVYGYTPKEGTQFSQSKWGVDWTDPEATASARATRLEYHQGLEEKQAWVADQRASGVSDETIARQINEDRNASRMSYYSGEELENLKARNLETYGNPNGPTYESFIAKGKTDQDIIASATRSNASMDVLTGIASVK
ncbi:putative Zn-binding protein involved in type VI secretion [Paraburkholderia terricola]|uniref:PAAR domain-containing protein n=1 Tax=Paraburkholderia terricola TaxID=169427 RepID=UPI00285C0095|nr:PAAR domain-containing protein [Paraburkholderia terricola]MDR6496288.1 putative Zn-binding protein involved in type VI secretion [Paraburkholderia terricola]